MLKDALASREKFTWFLTGNPTLEIYGITFPFSFTVSEQQRDFRQPFNQYGVSPYYKWIKVHAGYRNISFSQFTLGGHTMLGGGVELTPGKFRFGFMYGRLFKAIQAVGNPDGTFIATPSFRRTAASLKVGYGTEQNFVDIILLKGQDDENSINYASTETMITPAENFVAGLYTKQQFLKNFLFEFEFSKSVYTKNIDENDEDTLKGDFFNKPFSSLMDHTNASTSYSTAIEGALGYRRDNYSLRVKYRELGPDYQSMGTYFMQNDIRNITLEPSVTLFKSQLQVAGSIGFQTDNLDHRRASTTQRKIGSVSMNGRAGSHYTGNLSYSNYDIGQAAGTVQLDTLIKVSQTTQSIGTMHNLMFSGERFMHNFMVSYNYQTLSDRNANTSVYSSYNTSTLLGSYLLSVIKLKLNFTGSYTYTTFTLPSQETLISGPTAGITKTFLKNALSINVSYSSLEYKVGKETQRRINRSSMNTTYRIAKKHRLSIRFYINQSSDEAEGVEPFKETKGDIGYAYTF